MDAIKALETVRESLVNQLTAARESKLAAEVQIELLSTNKWMVENMLDQARKEAKDG